jgi:hypothetical protein
MMVAHPPFVGIATSTESIVVSLLAGGTLSLQIVRAVLAWSTNDACLKGLPGRIDPGVTIPIPIGGVVDIVDVEQGVIIVHWVPTETPSSTAQLSKHLQRELGALTAAS